MDISKEFGLTLFGFDVIIPSNNDITINNEVNVDLEPALPLLTIIDVNYFPSYKEVTDFPIKLRKYLRKKSNFH